MVGSRLSVPLSYEIGIRCILRFNVIVLLALSVFSYYSGARITFLSSNSMANHLQVFLLGLRYVVDNWLSFIIFSFMKRCHEKIKKQVNLAPLPHSSLTTKTVASRQGLPCFKHKDSVLKGRLSTYRLELGRQIEFRDSLIMYHTTVWY